MAYRQKRHNMWNRRRTKPENRAIVNVHYGRGLFGLQTRRQPCRRALRCRATACVFTRAQARQYSQCNCANASYSRLSHSRSPDNASHQAVRPAQSGMLRPCKRIYACACALRTASIAHSHTAFPAPADIRNISIIRTFHRQPRHSPNPGRPSSAWRCCCSLDCASPPAAVAIRYNSVYIARPPASCCTWPSTSG